MKSFIVFAILAFSACNAAPALRDLDDSDDAEIISYQNNRSGDNSQYSYHVETSDGVVREESGKLVLAGKNEDNEDVYAFVVEGFYQYVGPDDVVYKTTYSSARDGFHAAGAHIPHNDEAAYAGALNEQARVVAEQARVAGEHASLRSGAVRQVAASGASGASSTYKKTTTTYSRVL